MVDEQKPASGTETQETRREDGTFKPGVLQPGSKPFSADNQPDPEAKAKGKLLKKTGRDLAKAILEMQVGKGKIEQGRKKEICEYFGIDPEEPMTIEMLLNYQKMLLALKGNSPGAMIAAGESLISRAHGMPNQKIEHDGGLAVSITGMKIV